MSSCEKVDLESNYESLPYETGNHYCDGHCEACQQPLKAPPPRTLPALPTPASVARTLRPRVSIKSSKTDMSYVELETRRIRFILVIGLVAIIFLQFLQLILTSISEVRTIKNFLWNDDAQIEIIRNPSSLPAFSFCAMCNLIYYLRAVNTERGRGAAAA